VDTDTVTLFFALLAVVTQVGLLFALVCLLGRRWAPIARLGDAAVETVAPLALPLALLVAAVATGGSLYLSEVADFPPCTLCWYQRIAMYPLVVILAVAVIVRDRLVRRYVVPIAIIGSLISVYHLLVERFPELETGSCDPNNPCSIIWVEHLGYVTIPAMALTAFLAIMVLTLLAPLTDPDSSQETS
jgi:disulfide bond formation protein DsbB